MLLWCLRVLTGQQRKFETCTTGQGHDVMWTANMHCPTEEGVSGHDRRQYVFLFAMISLCGLSVLTGDRNLWPLPAARKTAGRKVKRAHQAGRGNSDAFHDAARPAVSDPGRLHQSYFGRCGVTPDRPRVSRPAADKHGSTPNKRDSATTSTRASTRSRWSTLSDGAAKPSPRRRTRRALSSCAASSRNATALDG